MKPLKRSSALILIALALLLSVAKSANAQSPKNLPTVRYSQNKDSEQQKSQTQKTPTPSAIFPPTAKSSEPTLAPQSRNTASNSQSWHDWFWQNAAALVLGALALWGGCIALRTLGAIKQEADDARAALTKLERAWVFIISERARVSCVKPPNESATYPVSIELKRINTGRSVGWIVGGITRGIRTRDPLPDTPDYQGEQAYGPTPVPPNQEAPEGFVRLILSELEAEEFFDGSLKIWVVGLLRYKDVFGEPHDTQFCISIRRPFERPQVDKFSNCLMAFDGPPAYNRMT